MEANRTENLEQNVNPEPAHGLVWLDVVERMQSETGISHPRELSDSEMRLDMEASGRLQGDKTLKDTLDRIGGSYQQIIAWDQWKTWLKAYLIRNRIGKLALDPETLIEGFALASEILGREPRNAQEYQQAIMGASETWVGRKPYTESESVQKLVERTEQLEQSLIQKEQAFAALERAFTEQSQTLEQTRTERDAVRDEYLEEIEAWKEKAGNAMAKAKVKLASSVKKALAPWKQSNAQLTEEVEELTRRWEEGDWVARSELDIAQEESNGALTQLWATQEALAEREREIVRLDRKAQEAQKKVEDASTLRLQMNDRIVQYEQRISDLQPERVDELIQERDALEKELFQAKARARKFKSQWIEVRDKNTQMVSDAEKARICLADWDQMQSSERSAREGERKAKQAWYVTTALLGLSAAWSAISSL